MLSNSSITQEEDKIDLLMNKIAQLEKELSITKQDKSQLETEYSDLNKITIPLLQKQLTDTEKSLENIIIDSIRLENENNLLKASTNTSYISSLSKYFIPEYQDEKDKLILYQTNKIQFLTQILNDLKTKHSTILDEKCKLEISFNEQTQTKNQELTALKDQIEKQKNTINTLTKELKNISEMNNRLLNEIKSLNTLTNNYLVDIENYKKQINYFKNENLSQYKQLTDTLTRIKLIDTDYQNQTNILEDYKTKVSELDTKTYIFNVVSIGRIIENSSQIIFYKEGKNRYLVNIKYMTSSSKYNILDIESITQIEGEDSVVLFKFKSDKNQQEEKFRTKEVNKMLKVFEEFHRKAIQHLDIKKQKKEDRMKDKQMKKNVNDMFNIFNN